MAVALRFPEGTTLRGRSATDVLLVWGGVQWDPVKDLKDIRCALADRVQTLTGIEIDPRLPDDEFLTAVDAAGLAAVTYEGEKAKPPITRTPIGARNPDDLT